MEYYYNKRTKKWYSIDCIFDTEITDNALIADLRNARSNNKFIILRNKNFEVYGGIEADYIYRDIKMLKLLTYPKNKNNECWTYCAYGGNGISSRCRFPLNSIINKKGILKNFVPDYSYVIEYVEDVSYLGYDVSEEDKMKYRKKMYDELDDTGKLYYQLEGKYNFQ